MGELAIGGDIAGELRKAGYTVSPRTGVQDRIVGGGVRGPSGGSLGSNGSTYFLDYLVYEVLGHSYNRL
jgi:hypothetical protein